MNAKELEKYLQENCNFKVQIFDSEVIGTYIIDFSLFSGTIQIKYKIDYSKSIEENLSNIKYKVLYTIFK